MLQFLTEIIILQTFRALEEAKDRREQIKAAHSIDKTELKKMKQEIRELRHALENADSSKQ